MMILRPQQSFWPNAIIGRIERVLLGVLLVVITMPAAASPSDEIAAAFVDLLRRDDLRTTLPGAKGVIDRYDCIQIDRYEPKLLSQAAGVTTVEVHLHGVGAPMSRRLHMVPLPAD